jgi:hypothetical protein
MSWNRITTADILLTPAEQAVLNNLAGSSTVCAGILSTVAGEFIEAIQQGGNQIVLDGSVPDAIRPHVIARTRWLWLCEFPELKKFQTQERADLNDAAVKYRDQIATGHPKLAPPANPVSSGFNLVTMPALGEPKLRRFRWREEDGV